MRKSPTLGHMDIKKMLDEQLPAGLRAHHEEAVAIGAKFQLHIADCGDWFVDVSASGPTCTPGTGEGADCTLTISAEDFQLLFENPQTNGMQLYMAGKLQIKGNPMLAMKMARLFSFA